MRFSAGVGVTLLLVVIFQQSSAEVESSDARRLKRKLSIANNNFALNIMRLLPANKNIVLCPFCLSTALGKQQLKPEF